MWRLIGYDIISTHNNYNVLHFDYEHYENVNWDILFDLEHLDMGHFYLGQMDRDILTGTF